MAERKQMQKPQDIFLAQLEKSGCTRKEAMEFLSLVEQYREGRGKVSDKQLLAYLHADSMGMKAGFEDFMKRWDNVAKGKTKVSQLTSLEAERIIGPLSKQRPLEYNRLMLMDEEIKLPSTPPYPFPNMMVPTAQLKYFYPQHSVMVILTVPSEKTTGFFNAVKDYLRPPKPAAQEPQQLPAEQSKLESVPKKKKKE